MSYVIEIRKTGNFTWPASIGIIETEFYKNLYGKPKTGNNLRVVEQYPSELKEKLESMEIPSSTSFKGGIIYNLSDDLKEKIQILFEEVTSERLHF